MATDHYVVESQPVDEHKRKPSPASRGGRGWGMTILILLLVAGLGAGGYFMATAKDRERPSAHQKAAGHGAGASAHTELPRLEVVKPTRGGMARTTNQPGTVHAFDFAQLYAKVSGYVKELKVDRGSRVKMGD